MSYTKLTYHITFSTKGRVCALYETIRPRLFSYLAGTINKDYGLTKEVGGVDDHIHILCDIRPTLSISAFMSRLKSSSSAWLHREYPNMKHVTWQEGYGAFTVSTSTAPDVQKYIKEQERHHRSMSYLDELRKLLMKNDIDFKEKYLQ